MTAAAACPLCRSGKTVRYCEKQGFDIRRCLSCTNGFLDLPAGYDPAALYATGYHRKPSADASGLGVEDLKGYDDYFALEPALRKTFRRRLRELLRLQAPGAGGARPRRLLDVGCGPGYFLDEARRDFAAFGVEPGEEASRHARDVLGLDVRTGSFRARDFEPSSFDAVTLFDTIEHLADPVQALEDARIALKTGGILMVSTGDFASAAARLSGRRWHLLTPPDHLFYFTAGGLKALLARSGFEPLWIRYPHGHYSLDYAAERLVKSTRLGLAYRRLEGLRRLLRSAVVPLNLWDIMLAAARKR